MGMVHEALCKFMISCWIHLRIRNVFKSYAIYEIMWKNMVEPDMPQIAI